MKIILATGIYPPAIGGIATYAKGLAEGLRELGHGVMVITYGEMESGKLIVESDEVVRVSKRGSVIARWLRYAQALREVGTDSDVIIALSSVSVGMPLIFSGLKKPKHVLRLGGDFFWERYTDGGGAKSLREWYTTRFGFWKLINAVLMPPILHSFSRIVYSTEFQREIHRGHYKSLPETVVVENALIPTRALAPSPTPPPGSGTEQRGEGRPSLHSPFRLLVMSRFVGFKNLSALLLAMPQIPNATLTMVGSGPMEQKLRAEVDALGLQSRVTFRAPVHGEEKRTVFAEHNLLVIPSVTEISPNTALEARAAGLSVLLTAETGLSAALTEGMTVTALRTPAEIVAAVSSVRSRYDDVASAAAKPVTERSWSVVATEWDQFLHTL